MTGCSLAFLPLGRPNPCYVQNGANCNRPGNAVSLVMCLIIKKPAGRQIQADFLRNAWQDNDHGWGYFYLHDRSLCWRRGMALGDLLSHNQALPADAEVYLHLRKATYGPVCPDLAHPLPVREGLLLMHNGSIEHLAPQCPQASDTQELAEPGAGCTHGALAGLCQLDCAADLRFHDRAARHPRRGSPGPGLASSGTPALASRHGGH